MHFPSMIKQCPLQEKQEYLILSFCASTYSPLRFYTRTSDADE